LAVAFFDMTTLFILTQTKAQNIPLYLLFRLQYFFLGKHPLSIPSSFMNLPGYQRSSTSHPQP
jgi:hypothetical protein